MKSFLRISFLSVLVMLIWIWLGRGFSFHAAPHLDPKACRELSEEILPGVSWIAPTKYIFYSTASAYGPSAPGVVMAAAVDGTKKFKIADGSAVRDPKISPNGKEMLFIVHVSGQDNLILLNAGTQEVKTLTKAASDARTTLGIMYATWDSKSEAIAYVKDNPHTPGHSTESVVVINPQTLEERTLADHVWVWNKNGSAGIFWHPHEHAVCFNIYGEPGMTCVNADTLNVTKNSDVVDLDAGKWESANQEWWKSVKTQCSANGCILSAGHGQEAEELLRFPNPIHGRHLLQLDYVQVVGFLEGKTDVVLNICGKNVLYNIPGHRMGYLSAPGRLLILEDNAGIYKSLDFNLSSGALGAR